MDLFEFDELEKNSKQDFLIGCDEAGRGPAAGGVWAGAVCFFKDVDKEIFLKLNDSKKLSNKNREILYDLIKQNSFCAVKAISVEKIEQINILNASLLAMKYALEDVIEQIKNKNNIIDKNNLLTLVDGNKLVKNYDYNQKFIIKGDSKSASIAAASILAKVSRDKYMDKIAQKYPVYDWENNKGYLTKKHISAILEHGTCEYHRTTFLKNILNQQTKLNLK